jgi:hypothetical protein
VPSTKATSGAGSSWYQSKFVYQANQAGTVGTYLLYVGANPTTIRPDLTHINLIKLNIECLGTLQPNEIVMFAALATSSNLASAAGNFSLTMSKFGVVIAPVDTSIRVDASGALAVKMTSVAINNFPTTNSNVNVFSGSGTSIGDVSGALKSFITNTTAIPVSLPVENIASFTQYFASGTSPSATVYTGAGKVKSILFATDELTITHMHYISVLDDTTLLSKIAVGITFPGYTELNLPFSTSLKFTVSNVLNMAAVTSAAMQLTFIYSY